MIREHRSESSSYCYKKIMERHSSRRDLKPDLIDKVDVIVTSECIHEHRREINVKVTMTVSGKELHVCRSLN